jgi:aminopeptidase N
MQTDVAPEHYDVVLHFYHGRKSYEGKVAIQLLIDKPTSSFTLHASQRGFKLNELTLSQNERIIAITHSFTTTCNKSSRKRPESDNELNIEAHETLSPGQAQLVISFSGSVNKDQPHGLYSCHFASNLYLATVFEPRFAHQVFPCFDQWYFRTTFSLSLHGIPNDMICISNTKIKLQDNDHVQFERTLSMSPYLFAFTVGYYDQIQDVYTNNGHEIPLIVYHPKWNSKKGLALAEKLISVSKQALAELEKYLNCHCMLNKIDNVLVPKMPSYGVSIYFSSIYIITDGKLGMCFLPFYLVIRRKR